MNDILNRLLKLEEELQFTSFTDNDIWELGNIIYNYAKNNNLKITIDITRNRHQMFHYSFDGTRPDNDDWVKRKTNLVYRFGHSSFYMGQFLKSINQSIEEKFLIKESKYAPHGGCFPVIIKNVGPIGTVTVSGLKQEDDHDLVVSCIKKFLKK